MNQKEHYRSRAKIKWHTLADVQVWMARKVQFVKTPFFDIMHANYGTAASFGDENCIRPKIAVIHDRR